MSTSERMVTGWCGVLFGPLVLLGMFFSGAPGGGYYVKDIAAYVDADNGAVHATALLMMLLGAALLLRFAVGVRGQMMTASGENTDYLAQVVTFSGVAWATTIAIGACVLTAAPMTMLMWDTTPAPANEVLFLFAQLGYFIYLAAGGIFAASMMLPFGVLAGRGAFGSWMRWFTWFSGAAILLSVAWFPIVMIPVWSIVTGIAVLRGRTASA